MVREFEGKSEQEAIDNAVEELNLDREHFDVEIVESTRKGIFRKGNVKIRVYIEEDEEEDGFELDAEGRSSDGNRSFGGGLSDAAGRATGRPTGRNEREEIDIDPEPQDEFEEKVIAHLEEITKKMGYPGRVHVGFREKGKVGLSIDSEHSGILIGKKGKNLDALQLLTNIYAGKLDEGRRVVVDAENYRSRHEENIVRMANKTASQVRKSRRSRLLEPMNPFERRLVHTTLNEMDDIETRSEGDGLYKQVRIIYRGNRRER